MAKKIKAIQCPQCSSTNAFLVSKNHYNCKACSTSFFLDDNDITINVNLPNRQKPNFLKWVVVVIIAFAVFIIGLVTCSYIVLKNSKNNKFYTDVVNTNSNTYYYNPRIFISKGGRPILIAIESLRNINEDEKLSLIIRDLDTEKIISKQEVKRNNHVFYTRTFNDGSVYIITEDKMLLYYLDRESYNFVDVTEQMFSENIEFVSGLSSIEFVYDDLGDGFKAVTHMGKELYYYPVIDKVFTKDEFHRYPISNNYKIKTIYDFNKENADAQDTEPLHLYKIDYKYDGGIEGLKIYPGWSSNSEMLLGKSVISITDLTPDRVYIKPKVLFFDNQEILIVYKANLKKDAPLVLQSLKIPSMNINWSLNLQSTVEIRPGYNQDIDIRSAIKTDSGYFIADQSNVYYKISDDGKLIYVKFYNNIS